MSLAQFERIFDRFVPALLVVLGVVVAVATATLGVI